MPTTIPPWLMPRDYTQASQAGAALGNQVAQRRASINQAAGQLGLGYAQLGAQRAAAGARARQEAAAANALQQFRAQQLQRADVREQFERQRQAQQDAAALLRQGESDWQIMNLGNGAVARVNRLSGDVEPLVSARGIPDPLKREKLRSLRQDLRSIDSREGNLNYILSADSLAKKRAAILGDIADLERELGVTETPASVTTGTGTNPPAAAAALQPPRALPGATNASPKAVGGYRIGVNYGGMKYLGGDPNVEANWEVIPASSSPPQSSSETAPDQTEPEGMV